MRRFVPSNGMGRPRVFFRKTFSLSFRGRGRFLASRGKRGRRGTPFVTCRGPLTGRVMSFAFEASLSDGRARPSVGSVEPSDRGLDARHGRPSPSDGEARRSADGARALDGRTLPHRRREPLERKARPQERGRANPSSGRASPSDERPGASDGRAHFSVAKDDPSAGRADPFVAEARSPVRRACLSRGRGAPSVYTRAPKVASGSLFGSSRRTGRYAST